MRHTLVATACVLWFLCGCASSDETHAAPKQESRKSANRRSASDKEPVNEADASPAQEDRDASAGGASGSEAPRAGSAGPRSEPRDEAGAGTGGAGTSGSGAIPAATSGAGGGSSAAFDECFSIDVRSQVTPTVWLLIDGSGSMADPFGPPDPPPPGAPDAGVLPSPTRWDALRETLLDPATGVVPKLAHEIKFGMVMYDGPLGGAPIQTLPDGGPATGMPPTTECPRLATVEPKLDNLDAFNAAFPAIAPGGSTPTHKALAHLISRQPPAGSAADPTYVVLATDGAPNDFCSADMNLGGIFGQPSMIPDEVIQLTQQLAMQGTPMYVISLAASDQLLSEHLAKVASAGGTNMSVYTPETKDRLVDTFRQLINPSVLCTIRLPKPRALRDACMGRVKLNDETLECDGPNGWKLRDSMTLELTGAACETFKAGAAHVEAAFPCPNPIEN
ncbi:MAG TPA: vWA domain-containing protein [Polyangiales bacterium]|nr:vWA domain-containing protein [Polyangiales bacterium]